MILDPYEAPPATLCDPHRLRDLNPSWNCDVPGCDCGSTPSELPDARTAEAVAWLQELGAELRHRYDLLELDREAERLREEARELRDSWWVRLLRRIARWLS